MSDPLLVISDEVRAALAERSAIVALESSVIAQGLPWPVNLETAIDTEDRVRCGGAVPATVAVIDGKMRVGVSRDEIERIARSDGMAKASSRDLPILRAQQRSAATTVAGTLCIARLAGIPIMATGGIGGVHRSVAQSADVSADLAELAQSPLMVVCSGAKVILDLPRTLEHLESLGVPVVGYQAEELPAFFARSSGLPLEFRVDTPGEAAELIRAARQLGSRHAIVLTNAPPENLALPADVLEQTVTAALELAESMGIQGKGLTPFLLARVRDALGTRAIDINRAILGNNAQLAAEIACVL